MTDKSPKIALVYDRVNTTYGGAEQVLLALHQAFPKAPLFTAIADQRAWRWAQVFQLHTSWLQKIPLASYFHRLLAPLMPFAFESLDLSQFNIVISVTSAECKGVLTLPTQRHICYLLSPPRYLYHQQAELVAAALWSKIPLLTQIGAVALKYLTWWDQVAMSRPDVIVPLSNAVALRYQQIYFPKLKLSNQNSLNSTKLLRLSKVIYPPIQLQSNPKNVSPPINQTLNNFCQQYQDFLLIVARLVAYKKVDLAIAAAQQLNLPLIIVGTGPEENRLKKMLSATRSLNKLNESHESNKLNKIIIVKNLSDHELNYLFTNCRCVIVPGIEDFGLTALEANSHGKPVIIHAQAGAAEVIQNNLHGILLTTETTLALIKAIKKCYKINTSSHLLRQNAAKYDTSIFVSQIKQLVLEDWQTHRLAK